MTTVLAEKKPLGVTTGLVAVRPYVDPKNSNMGLERYDMVLHQGTSHKEQLTCLEVFGIRRHLTGLNEFAPEIEKMADGAQKKAVVKQIREKVAYLERSLVNNDVTKYIDSKDPKDFWDKVEHIKWNNYAFWDTIFMEMTNDPIFLDPKNPADFIKICCIEAGGFSEIAKSLEDARSSTKYMFYLDKKEETAAIETHVKKIKNRALAVLDDLYNKDAKKLWWVAKNIDSSSTQYKNDIPNDIVYDNMDNYINGLGIEKVVTEAAKTFIDYAESEIEELRIRGTVRDAFFYKYILKKPDGNMYHNESSILLGKNMADCVEYLKNPANAELWDRLLKQVKVNL